MDETKTMVFHDVSILLSIFLYRFPQSLRLFFFARFPLVRPHCCTIPIERRFCKAKQACFYLLSDKIIKNDAKRQLKKWHQINFVPSPSSPPKRIYKMTDKTCCMCPKSINNNEKDFVFYSFHFVLLCCVFVGSSKCLQNDCCRIWSCTSSRGGERGHGLIFMIPIFLICVPVCVCRAHVGECTLRASQPFVAVWMIMIFAKPYVRSFISWALIRMYTYNNIPDV